MSDKDDGEWTAEKSVANLLACNPGSQRTEDDLFSSDYTRPTISGGVADLAAGINGYHGRHRKEES